MSPLSQHINKSEVLAKAAWKAAEQLGLKPEQFIKILHLEGGDSDLSELQMLDPSSQQGEIALILIRIYKAIYSLNGGDIDWMHHFLNSPNLLTGGVPIKQMESMSGLLSVLQTVEYLQH
ncbi:hypothetical protein E0H88_14575 [Acinetobacter sp. ANC 4216]|jgi:hypothetical protein|uniref:hypothetical protein n=1 Tax=Acinetobacter sp. ANC 4216 TaxID=2529840 RepID=UPI00104030B1|nr:hypothetical protein [Acinetobacter sp. ANC 4216]TCB64875.1 hypothetical protein E0H88_14575 [Acinetobacter sp. ANC 4216]